MSAKEPKRSGRWTFSSNDRQAAGVLSYQPGLSPEALEFEVTSEQGHAARALARKGDAGRLRDLFLTEELRSRALSSAGTSALISANTWRWALPLFGGRSPTNAGAKRGGR